ncbi:MAG: hypothetical protein AWU57_1521 [Marinobacter sp. T13-3]|nr:MAG: hypothetical protein AWU57_1521 [Marinobacter sp. T13-3]
MAAFIQKLFKTRKATPIKKIARPEKQEASQPPAEDERKALLKEQEGQLSNNPEQTVLATLAIDGATAAIRLQAARGLHEETYLQQVQKQAKGRDKGVYQLVKQALQSLREQQHEAQATQETIAGLIQQAKEQAASEDTKLYQARLDSLLDQWRSIEAQASTEQVQAFLEAVHQCRERQTQIEQAQQEEQRHQEQARERQETLNLLAETLTELTTPNAQPPSASALDALQKTQENRWLEATRDTNVSKQEQKAYEQSMLALRNFLGAVRRLDQAREALEKLGPVETASDEQTDAARQLLQDIAWPNDFPLPAELLTLKKQAGKAKSAPVETGDTERQKRLNEALKTTFTQLEAALESKLYKESKQLLKTAQNQFQKLDGNHRKKLQARMHLLAGQFRELSDWQGFATQPKQISLCEQMEYLADQPMDPEAKAERIKELQNEWRELGGSSDRALWTRFKTASDQAYEPCKAYFEAKSDLKQANLEKRQAICGDLALFLEKADWSIIDWKTAERIHQTARQEWKEAWPVDFRDNRQVQKRFDSLLKQVESPLDEERKNNEAIKQQIVERAEALIDHEPLQEAMDQAKALQGEWQAVGITRHREDRKLWKAFRRACDEIFARRDAHRSARQEETEQADQQARNILAELVDINASSDEERLDQARATLNQLNGQPLSKDIRSQVQELRKHLANLKKARQLHEQVDNWKALIADRIRAPLASDRIPEHWPKLAGASDEQNNQDLVIRTEILTGAPSPEAHQPRRMEIQVQRLADGLGGGEHVASSPEAIEQLIARWCLQVDDDGITAQDAERLNAALDAFLKPE